MAGLGLPYNLETNCFNPLLQDEVDRFLGDMTLEKAFDGYIF
jgi:hypothetical protein